MMALYSPLCVPGRGCGCKSRKLQCHLHEQTDQSKPSGISSRKELDDLQGTSSHELERSSRATANVADCIGASQYQKPHPYYRHSRFFDRHQYPRLKDLTVPKPKHQDKKLHYPCRRSGKDSMRKSDKANRPRFEPRETCIPLRTMHHYRFSIFKN